MKKLYERPLAEVIEIKAADIITASGDFTTTLGDTEGLALSDGNLDAYVNNGRIVIQTN